MRSSIPYIAYDVELVYSQGAYDICEGNDKILGYAALHDGGYYLSVVISLVLIIGVVEQLVYDIGVLLRKALSDL